MRYLAAAIAFVLLISITHAEITGVDVIFDINSDGSVAQSSRFIFKDAVSVSVNYTLDSSARNIHVSDGMQSLEYTLVNKGGTYMLNIQLKRPAAEIIIGYIVDGAVFRSNSIEHFFTELSFENPTNITAQATLPAGYVLYENSYRPAGAKIISDGRRIALQWNLYGDSVFFSVKYVKPEQESLWLAVIAILAGTLLFAYFYFRARRKEDFLFGFRHDEKLVIQYLEQKKIALQSDIEHDFKFSRAKATRITSKLVEKGIIKKQRYGRTNKLTWLR